MPTTISLHRLQALLGGAYVLVASVALLRSQSLALAAVAVGLLLGAYLTSRTAPERLVPGDMALKLCAAPLIIITLGIVADATGDRHGMGWAAVVMGYCAGNRFRAGGLGPAR